MSESETAKDWATVRASNRARAVAIAMSYLGADREKDAELLADHMQANIDTISAAAGGLLMPSAGFPESERILGELGEQMRQHSEELAQTAFRALGDVFWRTLAMATGRGPR